MVLLLFRPMTAISLKGLTKRFGTTTAVDGVDLDIATGELFFLLGPSGCGKTTLLRMLAGFIDPTAGSIRFGERDVTHLPPNKRNTGMVFQSYALWPHMSVIENVKYGLTLRKIPTGEREKQAREALAVVHMDQCAGRKPNELSGGQQQRVALARAIVVKPDLLLLDEPLSNLDAKLRLEMRSEIRRICTAVGMTTVYVTHDQKEALSIADRLAVLRDGQIQQVGEPRSVYRQPCSAFVAGFIGETNFVRGTASGHEVSTPLGTLQVASSAEGPVNCSIRPEAIKVHDGPGANNGFEGTRLHSTYLGEIAQHEVAVGQDQTLRIMEGNPRHMGGEGDTLYLSIDPGDIVLVAD